MYTSLRDNLESLKRAQPVRIVRALQPRNGVKRSKLHSHFDYYL